MSVNGIQILQEVGTNISMDWTCHRIFSPLGIWAWFLHMPSFVIFLVISCIFSSVWTFSILLYWVKCCSFTCSRMSGGKLSRCPLMSCGTSCYLCNSLCSCVTKHHAGGRQWQSGLHQEFFYYFFILQQWALWRQRSYLEPISLP